MVEIIVQIVECMLVSADLTRNGRFWPVFQTRPMKPNRYYLFSQNAPIGRSIVDTFPQPPRLFHRAAQSDGHKPHPSIK